MIKRSEMGRDAIGRADNLVVCAKGKFYLHIECKQWFRVAANIGVYNERYIHQPLFDLYSISVFYNSDIGGCETARTLIKGYRIYSKTVLCRLELQKVNRIVYKIKILLISVLVQV